MSHKYPCTRLQFSNGHDSERKHVTLSGQHLQPRAVLLESKVKERERLTVRPFFTAAKVIKAYRISVGATYARTSYSAPNVSSSHCAHRLTAFAKSLYVTLVAPSSIIGDLARAQ